MLTKAVRTLYTVQMLSFRDYMGMESRKVDEHFVKNRWSS